MSTQEVLSTKPAESAPDLTPLGKRLEILRIERGVSKQRLARHAGTSRQQLWRVMTGKSELTNGLRDRLARALAIEPASLVTESLSAQTSTHALYTGAVADTRTVTAFTVGEYLTDAALLTTTLRTMPVGDGGRRLKRALLNALEDIADETGRALPVDYSDIHRRVLSGEL